MSTVKTAVGRFVWHDHVSGDPEAARRFYTELLGWDYDFFDAGDWQYPMIKANGTTHGGFGPTQGDAPPHWLGHVYIDDVDAAAERVEAAGGSIVAPAMDIPDVGRMVVVADPQGAIVSLYHSVSDDFEPAEGVFVWDELMTTDTEAARRFYGEVVGWENRDMEMGEGNVYTLFSSGGNDRAGGMPIPPQAEGTPPNWMTYIGTGDVDATVDKAKKLGATVHMEPFDVATVGRLAIVADPTGAVFGLFKPLES